MVILPYLGEEDLYKQFKLNEPWDSVHNKKLIPKMPRIYAPIRVKAKEGETFYQVFTGEKLLRTREVTSHSGRASPTAPRIPALCSRPESP